MIGSGSAFYGCRSETVIVLHIVYIYRGLSFRTATIFFSLPYQNAIYATFRVSWCPQFSFYSSLFAYFLLCISFQLFFPDFLLLIFSFLHSWKNHRSKFPWRFNVFSNFYRSLCQYAWRHFEIYIHVFIQIARVHWKHCVKISV